MSKTPEINNNDSSNYSYTINNTTHYPHPIEKISFEEDNSSYVIEASAGTGKTWTVERLFIKALLERPLLQLSQILVVTFTNDATTELKTRILNQISKTIEILVILRAKNLRAENDAATSTNITHHNDHTDYIDYPDHTYDTDYSDDIFITNFLQHRTDINKDITLLLRCYQNFDHAAIHNIHGFCQRVLQEYPIECKINSPLNVVIDKTAQITKLVRDFFRECIINNPNFTKNIAQVYKTLDTILDSDYTTDYIQKIVAKLPLNKDLLIYRNGRLTAKYQVLENPDLNILNQDLSLIDNSKNQQEIKTTALTHLLSSVTNYIVAKHTTCEPDLTISCNEIIEFVADAMQNNARISLELSAKYPIAFIDEFQDTDILQWQIFSNIYNKGNRGILIVVGDPKQSIYRFRGADIDVYLEAQKQIGKHLELTENYRSHPHIVNFINQLFSTTPELLGKGIHYIPSSAKIDPNKLIQLPKNIHSIRDENNGQYADGVKFYDEAVQIITITGADAAQKKNNIIKSITLEILNLLHLDATLSNKIAILVPKNNEATQLVAHLKKHHINACEVKLGSIFATITAIELYNILLAISNLSDRNLLLKAATTSLFSRIIPIYQLRESTTLEYLQQEFFNYKNIWDKDGVLAVVYHLSQNLNKSDKSDHAGLSIRELSNLFQLGEILHKQTAHAHNHSTLLYWFKSKINDLTLHNTKNTTQTIKLDGNSTHNEEELVRLDNDNAQVIITTQHKAKGLEYDILFCPFFAKDDVSSNTIGSNYKLPFFATYNDSSGGSPSVPYAKLIDDHEVANSILNVYNTEIHRLNYVALTRAKSRLYIYLEEPAKRGKNYNSNSKVGKIHELFGYVKNNPMDTTHPLFNYPNLFINAVNGINQVNAINADSNNLSIIKDTELLSGVVFYHRNNLNNILDNAINNLDNLVVTGLEQHHKHVISNRSNQSNHSSTDQLSSISILVAPWNRQSYSSLTYMLSNKSNKNNIQLMIDNDKNDKLIEVTQIDDNDNTNTQSNNAHLNITLAYRYELLNQLRGAKFGTFFHELCEKYPLNESTVLATLQEYDIDISYKDEAIQMINEVFEYKLSNTNHEITLAKLKESSQYELEFNLCVSQNINLSQELVLLLAKYYGEQHPYTIAASQLPTIHNGFLNGFIDVCFMHEGKYYVLDYKTNTLTDYTSYTNSTDVRNFSNTTNICNVSINNALIHENASHHYYLQYLFYLVAIKRYLESRLQINDATPLIGGAIYYYVRGIFVEHHSIDINNINLESGANSGVYINTQCQSLVHDLDQLFK